MDTQSPFKVIILAYPGMTMLDAIGPNEVLGNSPYFDVQWVSTEQHSIANDQQSFKLQDMPYFKEINQLMTIH